MRKNIASSNPLLSLFTSAASIAGNTVGNAVFTGTWRLPSLIDFAMAELATPNDSTLGKTLRDAMPGLALSVNPVIVSSMTAAYLSRTALSIGVATSALVFETGSLFAPSEVIHFVTDRLGLKQGSPKFLATTVVLTAVMRAVFPRLTLSESDQIGVQVSQLFGGETTSLLSLERSPDTVRVADHDVRVSSCHKVDINVQKSTKNTVYLSFQCESGPTDVKIQFKLDRIVIAHVGGVSNTALLESLNSQFDYFNMMDKFREAYFDQNKDRIQSIFSDEFQASFREFCAQRDLNLTQADQAVVLLRKPALSSVFSGVRAMSVASTTIPKPVLEALSVYLNHSCALPVLFAFTAKDEFYFVNEALYRHHNVLSGHPENFSLKTLKADPVSLGRLFGYSQPLIDSYVFQEPHSTSPVDVLRKGGVHLPQELVPFFNSKMNALMRFNAMCRTLDELRAEIEATRLEFKKMTHFDINYTLFEKATLLAPAMTVDCADNTLARITDSSDCAAGWYARATLPGRPAQSMKSFATAFEKLEKPVCSQVQSQISQKLKSNNEGLRRRK